MTLVIWYIWLRWFWGLGGLVFSTRRLEQRASINGMVRIEGKTQGLGVVGSLSIVRLEAKGAAGGGASMPHWHRFPSLHRASGEKAKEDTHTRYLIVIQNTRL